MSKTKHATAEYKIRPVERYIVTKYVPPVPQPPEGGVSVTGSTTIAEVETRMQAEAIVKAFTGENNPHSAWNILPAHDVPSMLRNIASDEARWTKRGVVVLIQHDGQVVTFGLGAKVGDPHEILKLGRGQLKELYP